MQKHSRFSSSCSEMRSGAVSRVMAQPHMSRSGQSRGAHPINPSHTSGANRFIGTCHQVSRMRDHFRWYCKIKMHSFPTLVKWIFLARVRSEEHTSELQSLMRISYAV